ncbi:hypothetical protein HBI56_031270 [Parastagonospora nodorum]|uniref:Uncharacterized protein n=1 Tax=Phaeosphaeria nodorum (strain SN15 / ATCC MYA-4574 / FGSC 10173) TaxID=321614 RepID=A0A7U2HXA6_PHANO|nr:hypothetical protein HBH56_018980 [Parastagonospora nodorum]QRC95310.1 hypothetical protein JI435_407140 [Parastagonospora nodorum SN15]KAH3936768.1 hypothetical protein HBH54_015510 [Parastagonospora nodorum]KAH3953776.1 hypothetical protein HBH53_027680 [Parastagonospora nodorum]KAH3962677.1 hypothetical protein HBH51_174140 [Parastagonospora nodorum]
MWCVPKHVIFSSHSTKATLGPGSDRSEKKSSMFMIGRLRISPDNLGRHGDLSTMETLHNARLLILSLSGGKDFEGIDCIQQTSSCSSCRYGKCFRCEPHSRGPMMRKSVRLVQFKANQSLSASLLRFRTSCDVIAKWVWILRLWRHDRRRRAIFRNVRYTI